MNYFSKAALGLSLSLCAVQAETKIFGGIAISMNMQKTNDFATIDDFFKGVSKGFDDAVQILNKAVPGAFSNAKAFSGPLYKRTSVGFDLFGGIAFYTQSGLFFGAELQGGMMPGENKQKWASLTVDIPKIVTALGNFSQESDDAGKIFANISKIFFGTDAAVNAYAEALTKLGFDVKNPADMELNLISKHQWRLAVAPFIGYRFTKELEGYVKFGLGVTCYKARSELAVQGKTVLKTEDEKEALILMSPAVGMNYFFSDNFGVGLEGAYEFTTKKQFKNGIDKIGFRNFKISLRLMGRF